MPVMLSRDSIQCTSAFGYDTRRMDAGGKTCFDRRNLLHPLGINSYFCLVAVEKRNTNFPQAHYMFDIILVSLGKFNLDKHSIHNTKIRHFLLLSFYSAMILHRSTVLIECAGTKSNMQ